MRTRRHGRLHVHTDPSALATFARPSYTIPRFASDSASPLIPPPPPPSTPSSMSSDFSHLSHSAIHRATFRPHQENIPIALPSGPLTLNRRGNACRGLSERRPLRRLFRSFVRWGECDNSSNQIPPLGDHQWSQREELRQKADPSSKQGL